MDFDPHKRPEPTMHDPVDLDPRRPRLMLELPRQCPSCNHPFNMRFYPRRFRKTTLLYFVLCVLAAAVVAGFMPRGISMVAFIAIVVMLGGVGMTFSKIVHLKCRSCGWSQKFAVRNAR